MLALPDKWVSGHSRRGIAVQDVFDLGPHVPAQPVVAKARSLGEVFVLRARETPGAAASFEKVEGAWRRLSWGDMYDRARRVAHGLDEMGLAPGEVVAILGPTSVGWAGYELGSHLLGLVTVGVYPHQSAEQLRYLLEHSESRVIFVADEAELKHVLEAAEKLDSLRAIVPWDEALCARYAGRDERIVSPGRFTATPISEARVDERLAATEPGALSMLIYTSGTTGPPKGAMLTHANLLALLAGQARFIEFYQDDLLLSFLPMAHVAERNMAFWGRVNAGVAAAYASSIGAVLTELGEVRPTIFGAVPRLFEKIYAKVRGDVSRKPKAVQGLFAWAESVGRRRARCQLEGKGVPASLSLQARIADRLVLHKVRAALGGRVRACITGAAPIALDILEFLWSVGLPVYEVYGLTEATVATHANRAGATKLGTVGQPIPPMECRLAEDGEILLRGPFVFAGYLKNEEATREMLQDGWLYTGDVGHIDEKGFLRITDRKKHLIITAGGKNVAPANIERAIKTQTPLMSQVHAHGDRRPYITALIAPSPIETLEWGVENGLLGKDEAEARKAELMANPSARSEALNAAMGKVARERKFHEAFLEGVQRGNRELARVEQVRRYVVLERDFSQEEGEMTPSMKLKRKTIEQKFAALFDRIYDEPGFAIDVGGAGE
jgi:long-chain acyl-CoA synthetase